MFEGVLTPQKAKPFYNFDRHDSIINFFLVLNENILMIRNIFLIRILYLLLAIVAKMALKLMDELCCISRIVEVSMDTIVL